MMAAELNHPWLGGTRVPEDTKRLIFSAGGIGCAALGEDLIGVHDFDDLLMPVGAKQHLQEVNGSIAVFRAQTAKPKPGRGTSLTGKFDQTAWPYCSPTKVKRPSAPPVKRAAVAVC